MKKNLAKVMAAAAMAVVLTTAVAANAQSSGRMKVNVPFNFVVENDRLPAGDYTIEKVANGRLRIQSSDGRTTATVLALRKQGKKTAEAAHFIFHHYGSEYFLANIWTPGQESGWELMQGRLEMELARKQSGPVETAELMGH
jgi:hypothetical protein